MKFNPVTIAASTIVVTFAITTLLIPTQTHGREVVGVIDSSHSDYDGYHDVPLKKYRTDMQTQWTSRWLELDATCSNACDSDQISRFHAPFTDIELDEGSDNKGSLGRLFGRVTGFFENSTSKVGDWSNGLFSFWNRRRQDNRKYLIPTGDIVPLLSNSSAKIKSLVDMLRLEGANNDTSSSEFVKKLYDLSAENMEWVVMALEPILADMQQSAKIDIRTLGCYMTQISTLLRDVTLPNIEFIAQSIYTNSGNAELANRFNEYTEIAATRTSSTAVSKMNDSTCSVHDASRAATTARLFNDMDTGSTTRQSLDFGEVTVNLFILILYVLLFPISIVISLIGIVVTIILIPALLLFAATQIPKDDDVAEWILLFIALLLSSVVILPIAILSGIIGALVVIFEVLLAPLFPTDPSEVPARITFPPTAVPRSITAQDETTRNVMYHLSIVLESPLDTIAAVFQNENTFQETDQNDRDDMECEMAAFMCRNTALLDVLPF